MKYGFWTEFDEILEDLPNAEWGYLESELKTNGLTPYDFLHGLCNYFAQYLHDIYGYKMAGLYEEPDQMIHAYCTKEIDGVTYYIDVRGITDDWNEFIKEFYESGTWSGDYDYSYFLTGDQVNERDNIEEMRKGKAYEAAQMIDREYGYYDFPSYLQSIGQNY